jgi:hypothetical protein
MLSSLFIFLFGIYVGQEYNLPSVKVASTSVFNYIYLLSNQNLQKDKSSRDNTKNNLFDSLIDTFVNQHRESTPEKNE